MTKLYQIAEPDSEIPAEEPLYAIGIDLGTTNSLVAYSRGQQPRILKDGQGNSLIPSVVTYAHGKAIVGYEALRSKNFVSSVKRLMGKGMDNIKNPQSYPLDPNSPKHIVNLKIDDAIKNPIEISAEILTKLQQIAEQNLEQAVKNAVITVPAYFNDAARAATRDAARLAGLEVLRLLNEPTAAALAYGLDKREQGVYAIYDFGGGTFDVSILKLERGIFQVLASGGDNELGGDDLDRSILEHLIPYITTLYTEKEYRLALQEVRAIKEHLTSYDEWEGSILAVSGLNLKRYEMERIVMPYIDRTIKILLRTIREIELENVDEVVLVGGSTKMPLIKQRIGEIVGKKPLDHIDPEEIVALGAALQAEALVHGSDNLLLDICPLSLGIELLGGMMEVVIPRNTPIPAEVTKMYTTDRSGQTGMVIHVLQGEGGRIEECRSLAKFELSNLPALPAGQARIAITFKIDADGLLTVSAIEQSTNQKQEVVVKPSYGLTEVEILRLISVRN